jgi:beta-glucosidase
MLLPSLGVLLLLLRPPPLVAAVAAAPAFVFGAASAAWQYEGALAERGPSIWEAFCGGATPAGAPRCRGGGGNIAAVADDQFNLTKLRGDIARMRSMGMSAYRLSLAWSRVMPDGRSVRRAGVRHYRAVLQALRDAGIAPWVTLFHFDLPLALEREEGGWRNRSSAGRFRAYAATCFEEFGDLVDRWVTINEAHTIATAGYLYGVAAPGRCSDRSLCARGNGTTEPYVVAHNLLRAHGEAVRVFRGLPARLRGPAGGATISMVVSGDWTEPFDSTSARDREAAQRRQEFQIGWFADPIFYGDYPESMRDGGVGGGRLPRFTDEEKKMLKGSADFFALNHYTSRYGRAPDTAECLGGGGGGGGGGGANVSGGAGWDEDQCCLALTAGPDGTPIGLRPEGSDWLYAVPWGMQKLLGWVGQRYPGTPIWVTENGAVDPIPKGKKDPAPTGRTAAARTASMQNDSFRVAYHRDYLHAVKRAMVEDGVDVRGYFVWSLLDNVEWGDGLRDRFGLFEVARPSLARVAKASVAWLTQFIREW